MTLTERCQAGEARLEQVSAALLDARPDVFDRCEEDLEEVITLLEREPDSQVPADRLADRTQLERLRYRLRLLAMQTQHATNLCQGWIQLGRSEGYTDRGTPVLPPSEPRTSYEV
jgi:hypothetical protein